MNDIAELAKLAFLRGEITFPQLLQASRVPAEQAPSGATPTINITNAIEEEKPAPKLIANQSPKPTEKTNGRVKCCGITAKGNPCPMYAAADGLCAACYHSVYGKPAPRPPSAKRSYSRRPNYNKRPRCAGQLLQGKGQCADHARAGMTCCKRHDDQEPAKGRDQPEKEGAKKNGMSAEHLCGRPKKNGKPCGQPRLTGESHCRLHGPEKT